MDEYSSQMIQRYFKEYYFRFGSRIKTPSEIERREFGYLPFGGMMTRHLGFKDMGDLRALLVKEAPAGVYCSNSFYDDPSAEMHLKGWKKAELIFDIDSDALNQPCKKVHDIWLCKGCGKREYGLRPESCPSCKNNRILELSWACTQCIDAAKKETFKLLDFLEFDFGIASSRTKVYFSGNAGYHITVEKSQLEDLDTHGRAELADYLSGRGLSADVLDSRRLAPSDPGWRGRIARYIRDVPQNDNLFANSQVTYEQRLSEVINEFSSKKVEAFMDRVVSDNSVHIDAMVTTDIHRIFRMAETLNNKTGLVKRECEKDLSSFDPLIEAIALKEDDRKVEVVVDLSPKVELGGSSFGPFKSEATILPLFVAVYLMSKGAAKLVPNSGEKVEAAKQESSRS
jgi:DNA primase small subunit